MLSIWFFIGMLLFSYGVLILGSGILNYNTPPPVVMPELHADIWWGALLLLMGLGYILKFRPRRNG